MGPDLGWFQCDKWGVCHWKRKEVINQGKGLQWTETANRLGIKFCEYEGCLLKNVAATY